MQHHVDVDRLLRQALRPADHQHLLDERGNPVDAVEDHAAVLLRAPVVGEHPSHQLGRSLDAGQRILYLVREAGRRQPQAQVAGDGSLSRAFFVRQVVQQYDDAAGPSLGVQQRRHLDAYRQLARPGRQDRLHVAKILTALEARPDHPPQPVVLAHEIGHRRGIHLRNPQHCLGSRIDDLGFHRRREHDDPIGQAVDNVVPEIQSLSIGLFRVCSLSR